MTGEQREVVTFQLESQWVGIPVDRVQEIIPPRPLTYVPKANNAVAGLLNLRGQIVTAIDLRRRLKMADRKDPSKHMSIVIRHQGELFSLLVDEVGDVLGVSNDQMQAAPPNLDPAWKFCCIGVVPQPKGLMVVADIDRLLEFQKNRKPEE
jgi:purine-binding chemotaxis protein CheW